MQNSEVVRSWLDMAADDLESARILIRHRPPLNENACFHAQQAVEKSLKSILVAHGEFPVKTHALEDVLKEVSKYTEELDDVPQPVCGCQPLS
ncbi:MAG: HEPN domain-containing protein [Coriobacteriales bacterium]|jgi:HEPN domain-containing protein|nr:HEPN domain-containing protein [Coriobacteriales bacterium]